MEGYKYMLSHSITDLSSFNKHKTAMAELENLDKRAMEEQLAPIKAPPTSVLLRGGLHSQWSGQR